MISPVIVISRLLTNASAKLVQFFLGPEYDKKVNSHHQFCFDHSRIFLFDHSAEILLRTVYFGVRLHQGAYKDDLPPEFPRPEKLFDSLKDQTVRDEILRRSSTFIEDVRFFSIALRSLTISPISLSKFYRYLIPSGKLYAMEMQVKTHLRDENGVTTPVHLLLSWLVPMDEDWRQLMTVFGIEPGFELPFGTRWEMPKKTAQEALKEVQNKLEEFEKDLEGDINALKSHLTVQKITKEVEDRNHTIKTLSKTLDTEKEQVENLIQEKETEKAKAGDNFENAGFDLSYRSRVTVEQQEADYINRFKLAKEKDKPKPPPKSFNPTEAEDLFEKQMTKSLKKQLFIRPSTYDVEQFLFVVEDLPEFSRCFAAHEENVVRFFRLLLDPKWMDMVTSGTLFRVLEDKLDNAEELEDVLDDVYNGGRKKQPV